MLTQTNRRTTFNVVANIVGRGFAVLSGFVFLPFYLAILGAEAFGVIGLYSAILGIVAVSDLGLTATLNREMARLTAMHDTAGARDTVKTISYAFLFVVSISGAAIVALAPLIAERWITVETLDTGTVTTAIRLMGVAIAFQLLSVLQNGALVGLQKQVSLNAILILTGVLRGVGAVVILVLVSESIVAFFLWQIVVNAFQFTLLRLSVWRALRLTGHKPRFRASVVATVWRYTAGLVGMSVTSTILLQTDKVVLSGAISLEAFGLYAIAWTAATLPSTALANPVQRAFFPRLTQAVTRGDEAEMRHLYGIASQLVAVAVLPVGAVMILFSEQVLIVWLGNAEVAHTTAPTLALLTVAMTLTGLLIMPYAAQLAHAWTSLAVTSNVAAVLVFVPVLLALVDRWGSTGAAIAWITLNATLMAMILVVMHRRILIGAQWKWLSGAVVLPLLGAFAPASAMRLFLPTTTSRFAGLASLATVWLTATVGAALATPIARNALQRAIRGRPLRFRNANSSGRQDRPEQ